MWAEHIRIASLQYVLDVSKKEREKYRHQMLQIKQFLVVNLWPFRQLK